MATPDPLLTALVDAVGAEHVLTDPDLRASYETDWTGRWNGTARAVVRPAHWGEVSDVVRICGAHGVPLVPQGGNTGLVGGSVPRGGEVVLSLRRLDELRVDARDQAIYAGAGATLAAVQRAAAEAGFSFGVDLASRGSATIGGMVATNAGGIHVLRYGSMRRQVIGLQAVLPDGSQVAPRIGGLAKDNIGYDLAELLVGSEGTLGVVTGARLRLVPIARHRVTALVGLDSAQEAVDLLPRLRALPSLEAAELMFDRGVHLVAMHARLPLPFDPLPPVLLLIECADQRDPGEELAAVLRDCLHVAVGVQRQDRWRLWAYRERHTEAINALGVPLKFDVGVSVPSLPQFIYEIESDIEEIWPEAVVVVFGHLADGNVHINVLAPEDAGRHAGMVDGIVLRHVLSYRGAVSAEHGIGVAKRHWLAQARHPSELAPMRAIKDALDPKGILNPGVLLPPA